ncbi:hypothetical protein [Lignipirellula cremea]|uniref:Uncharacterized protein n=1 Tax=Lignipirellula cremea TaxID=2528010 RepID=A0A518DVU3_9BACT|nr:hypothetical protein [Lignipirellula cremea]QDU95956.1 hypothetical protein Pla8534_37750 [Lignipirellula cremea]
MTNSETEPELLTFGGSLRVGFFTAQLGVELAVNRATLILSASGRSFRIDRDNFQGLEETSILGIFKRGIRFRHCQPNLTNPIIFYPAIGREALREQIQQIGWT